MGMAVKCFTFHTSFIFYILNVYCRLLHSYASHPKPCMRDKLSYVPYQFYGKYIWKPTFSTSPWVPYRTHQCIWSPDGASWDHTAAVRPRGMGAPGPLTWVWAAAQTESLGLEPILIASTTSVPELGTDPVLSVKEPLSLIVFAWHSQVIVKWA